MLAFGPKNCTTMQLTNDAFSMPSVVETIDSCGGLSSVKNNGSFSSPLEKKWTQTPFTSERKKYVDSDEEEMNATSYVSIIHRLQEKVRVLQRALLASDHCSSLLGSLERDDEQSLTDVSLHQQQQEEGSGEGNITRKMRKKWSQAVEANDAITSLEYVSSKIHADDFNGWMNEKSISSMNNKCNEIHVDSFALVGREKYQEEMKEVIITPNCYPNKKKTEIEKECGGGGAFFVHPVILVDITSVMNREKHCCHADVEFSSNKEEKEQDTSRSREKSVEQVEVERLVVENKELREESSAMRRELETGREEIKCQKAELAELTQRVDELQACNAALKDESAAMQRRCLNATDMSRLSGMRLNELADMIESLRADNDKMRSDCEEARRDADDAWGEVRRLERELRGWGAKERELRRLRLLMRFSELKKDSDRLAEIAAEMGHAESERDRLREENRRCHALLAECRGRLDAVAAEEGSRPRMSGGQTDSTESSSLPQSSSLQSTTTTITVSTRPHSAGVTHGPRKPPTVSVKSEREAKKRTAHVRQGAHSFGERTKRLSVFRPSSGGASSLFVNRSDGAKSHRSSGGRSGQC